MQAPIVTLTMNPALDVSTEVDRVLPERKLRCGPRDVHAGGGGVNVTRAIHNLGGSSIAVFPLGGPDGEAYRTLARKSGVAGQVITIAGNTAMMPATELCRADDVARLEQQLAREPSGI